MIGRAFRPACIGILAGVAVLATKPAEAALGPGEGSMPMTTELGLYRNSKRLRSASAGMPSLDHGGKFGSALCELGASPYGDADLIAVASTQEGEVHFLHVSANADAVILGRSLFVASTSGFNLRDTNSFGTTLAGLPDLDANGCRDIIAGMPAGNGTIGTAAVLRLGGPYCDEVLNATLLVAGEDELQHVAQNVEFGIAVANLLTDPFHVDGIARVAVGTITGGGDTGRGGIHVLELASNGSVVGTPTLLANGTTKIGAGTGGSGVKLDLEEEDLARVGTALAVLPYEGPAGPGTDQRERLVAQAFNDDIYEVGIAIFDIEHVQSIGIALHAYTVINPYSSSQRPFGLWAYDMSRFGDAIAAAGDVDGDGHWDLFVGVPLLWADEGGAAVIRLDGSTNVIEARVLSESSAAVWNNDFYIDEFFGGSVAIVNSSSFGRRIMVGATGFDSDTGALHVLNRIENSMVGGYKGDGYLLLAQETEDLGPSLQKIGVTELREDGEFGLAMATCGDWDGNGVEDLLVGQPDISNEETGAVYGLYMHPNGTVKEAFVIHGEDSELSGFSIDEDSEFGIGLACFMEPDVPENPSPYAGLLRLAVGATKHGTDGVVFEMALHPSNGSIVPGMVAVIDTADPVVNGRSNDDDMGNGLAYVRNATLIVVGQDDSENVFILRRARNGTLGQVDELHELSQSFVGDTTGDYFGNGISAYSDWNGDGLEDVLVSSENGHSSESGEVYLVALNVDGAPIAFKAVRGDRDGRALAGVTDDGDFGTSVERAGDLDGNGVEDIIVGADDDRAPGGNTGSMYAIFMGEGGEALDSFKIFGANFGGYVLEGDAIGDSVGILRGCRVPVQDPERASLDYCFAIGAADMLAPDDESGGVWLVAPFGSQEMRVSVTDVESGNLTLTAETSTPNVTSRLYGQAYASYVGDYDGDGEQEAAMAGIDAENSRYGGGILLRISNGASSPITSRIEAPAGQPASLAMNFSGAVSSAGLVDGDAAEDIVTSTVNGSTSGTAPALTIVLMAPNAAAGAPGSPVRASAIAVAPSIVARTVCGVGDVDGDGIPDVAAGDPLHDEPAGEDRGLVTIAFLRENGTVRHSVELSLGRTSGLEESYAYDGDALGFSLAGLGDINGDGVPDLAAGAPRDGSSHSDEEPGMIWLFMLNPDGSVLRARKISKVFDPLVFGTESDSRLGLVIGRAGDLDNDGVPDILVGPYEDDSSEVHGLLLRRSGDVKEQFKVAIEAPSELGSSGAVDRVLSVEAARGAQLQGRRLYAGQPVDSTKMLRGGPSRNYGRELSTEMSFGSGILALGALTDSTSDTRHGAMEISFVSEAVVPNLPSPSPTPSTSSSPSPSPTPSVSSSPSNSPTPSVSSSPSNSPTPSASSSSSPSNSPTPSMSSSPTSSPAPSSSSSPTSSPALSASSSPSPSPSSSTTRPQGRELPDSDSAPEGTETCTDQLPATVASSAVLVETSVNVGSALPADIGCDSAEAYVASVVAAAGLEPEDVVFWVQETADGYGSVLVLQVPAESPQRAEELIALIEPQLSNSTILDNLVAGAGSGAYASYNNDSAVVDSPYLDTGGGDDDPLLPIWLWVVIAAGAAVLGGCIACFACGACKRDDDDDEEKEDYEAKKARNAGVGSTKVVPQAAQV